MKCAVTNSRRRDSALMFRKEGGLLGSLMCVEEGVGLNQ